VTDRVLQALHKIAAGAQQTTVPVIPPTKLRPGFKRIIPNTGIAGLDTAVDFTGNEEGARVAANGRHYPYNCIAGKRTIGYGLTNPDIVKHYGTTGMSELQAQVHFNNRVLESYNALKKGYPNFVRLNPNQQAALVDQHFHYGADAFARSTIAKKLNAWDVPGITDEFGRWGLVNGVPNQALRDRQARLRTLWLTPYEVKK